MLLKIDLVCVRGPVFRSLEFSQVFRVFSCVAKVGFRKNRLESPSHPVSLVFRGFSGFLGCKTAKDLYAKILMKEGRATLHRKRAARTGARAYAS
jgi:hypothetical protein